MTRKPIIAMEYEGPVSFSDAAQVNYILRDLFSQTADHPPTVLTDLNFVAEYDWTDRPVFKRAYHNEQSADKFERFKSEMPNADAASDWRHDVAYFAFIIDTPDGWVSNFVSGTLDADGHGIDAHDPLVASYCLRTVFQDDYLAMEGMIGWMLDPGDTIRDYRTIDLKSRIVVDKALYAHMSREHPVHPVIATLHNDQDLPAHFHRVVWSV